MAAIKWNMAGFEALRRSPGIKRVLLERGQKIANKAGEGIAAVPGEGRSRSRVAVLTINGVGVGRNAHGHVIIKAIDAGRH